MSDLLEAFTAIPRFVREATDTSDACVSTEQEVDCQDCSRQKPLDRGVRRCSCVVVHTRNIGRRTSCYLLGGPRPQDFEWLGKRLNLSGPGYASSGRGG
jgi:hypothetical protein